MFLGRHAHAVDSKGRLAVPARFRDDLGDGLVLTRGIDRCLSLYPMAAWVPLAGRVSALSVSDPDARNFRRMVFAEAVDLTLDGQGRILIPPELRAYAEIEREAVIVGVHDAIEIWSPARWETMNTLMEQDGAAIAQRLAALI
jgi:MraZ protein